MSIFKLVLAVASMAFINSGTLAAGFSRTLANAPRENWGGKSGDLSVVLTFEQGSDSLFARGAYQVANTKKVGCGGETLAPSGFFTMRAKGTRQSFRGRFLFDAGWTPPVSGSRMTNGNIKVSIRSVDRGVCSLILRRTTKHNPASRR